MTTAAENHTIHCRESTDADFCAFRLVNRPNYRFEFLPPFKHPVPWHIEENRDTALHSIVLETRKVCRAIAAGILEYSATEPFRVGEAYQTRGGKKVTIVEESNAHNPYWCVRGDDGIWRYNRAHDRGRVTGSAFDMSDMKNLVPEQSS